MVRDADVTVLQHPAGGITFFKKRLLFQKRDLRIETLATRDTLRHEYG